MPLRKLIAGNLREAHKLGMIECNAEAIEDSIAVIESEWDTTNSKENEYAKWMENAKREFHQKFRPIQAFKGKTIPFCNIMQLKQFSQYWLENLEPSMSDREAGRAKDQITVLAVEEIPASEDSLILLQECFLRLNQWLKKHTGGRRQGIPIEIGLFLNPAARPFWVGGNVNKPNITAQYWRDRLGLIHISAKTKSCRELLVRLRFVAKMADDVLLRNEHLEHRHRHSEMLWVFRPSILHQGNARFVQGVMSDRMSRPAHRGSTRDISSDHYFEGERELILLTGERASARLIGVDLLDGFASNNPALDDDDHGFVKCIAQQRGWA